MDKVKLSELEPGTTFKCRGAYYIMDVLGCCVKITGTDAGNVDSIELDQMVTPVNLLIEEY